jgi:hypothetical protein
MAFRRQLPSSAGSTATFSQRSPSGAAHHERGGERSVMALEQRTSCVVGLLVIVPLAGKPRLKPVWTPNGSISDMSSESNR